MPKHLYFLAVWTNLTQLISKILHKKRRGNLHIEGKLFSVNAMLSPKRVEL
jgi:hypothetical protein